MRAGSLAAACAVASFLWGGGAAAAELTWYFESNHPNAVSLEFYSQDRNAAWPGGGEVYVIRDWERHTYTLSCNYGEQICFGEWVRGDSDSYWGVGYNGEQWCGSCCYAGGYGDTQVEVLNP